ncbi:MAG: AmmeMemoRadiSam system protein B, partial [Candidatus Omnitrophica bacterium]|nr:AmmeMemoRadiSam system protein B [Candidatus Omnitrophota bacterium]
AVSGMFYPAEPAKLREMINGFLTKVPSEDIKGELKGLIVPHAGYEFSGGVAAFAYKPLAGKTFDSVIILGLSHRVAFEGISVCKRDFATPLGIVRVNQELADKIISHSNDIKFDMLPHLYEHSIEVEIPFLQVSLGNFSFVPVLMRNMNLSYCQVLADAIYGAINGKNVLVVASSDMSHYHDYNTAVKIDKFTLDLIKENKIEELGRAIEESKAELCGSGPVITLMLLMKKIGADKIKILKYANSGDATSDYSKVVGYTAVAFSSSDKDKEEKEQLSKEARKELLDIARRSIEIFLKYNKIPEIKIKHPELMQGRGAFVTLKKNGRLRGCIGNFEPAPLYLQAQNMAISAATRDRRFVSMNLAELKDIEIEISVLSPMKEVYSVDEIIAGRHGIYVKYGPNNGCYLPQVALEAGWTSEELVRSCFLEKAGLPEDMWEKGARVFTFTAEVFSEKEKL